MKGHGLTIKNRAEAEFKTNCSHLISFLFLSDRCWKTFVKLIESGVVSKPSSLVKRSCSIKNIAEEHIFLALKKVDRSGNIEHFFEHVRKVKTILLGIELIKADDFLRKEEVIGEEFFRNKCPQSYHLLTETATYRSELEPYIDCLNNSKKKEKPKNTNFILGVQNEIKSGDNIHTSQLSFGSQSGVSLIENSYTCSSITNGFKVDVTLMNAPNNQLGALFNAHNIANRTPLQLMICDLPYGLFDENYDQTISIEDFRHTLDLINSNMNCEKATFIVFGEQEYLYKLKEALPKEYFVYQYLGQMSKIIKSWTNLSQDGTIPNHFS